MTEGEASRWQWLSSIPTLVKALILVPIAAFLFNWFAPGIWEEGRQRLLGESPLDIVLGEDQDYLDDGWSMALSTDLPRSSRPSKDAGITEVRAWLKSHGAVDVGESHLRMAIRGIGRHPTLISSMRARIVSRAPVIDNILVTAPSAGASDTIKIGFDLDSERPVALRNDSATGEFGDRYFDDNFITVNPGEIVVFDIVGRAGVATYNWMIELDIQYQDGEETVAVDFGDSHLRTTAFSEQYQGYFDWAWYEGGGFLPVDAEGSPLVD